MKEKAIKILSKTPFYKQLLFIYKSSLLYGKLLAKIVIIRFPIDKNYRGKKKPRVLQLPITYKCNFDCVMCGMHNMIQKNDFSVEQLSAILNNSLFSDIESVGISGGEPFLKKDLLDYIKAIISNLPKLKYIYIISNGYYTESILNKLASIKAICSENNVLMTISFSLDGIGDMQDFMRGKTGAFDHIVTTCSEISKNKIKYCDNLGLICTITKHNIYRINEVDIWANMSKIPITYNVATLNKRIYNENKYENFSVFTDKQAQYLTAEFFYAKFRETQSPTYFALYFYVLNQQRITSCIFKYDGVTLTPDSNIAYCATYSEELGNALEQNAEQLYYKCFDYRQQLSRIHCSTCSHYCGVLTLKGTLEYNKEILRFYNNPLRFHT